MAFRLPSSKNKRYLTGADWIINMIDYANKKVTGVGNQSQIVVELAGSPSTDDLRKKLRVFLKNYPIVNGRISRDYINLAPYWKFDRKNSRPPKLKVYDVEAGQMPDELEQAVNTPFDDDREHLTFRLITSEGKSSLIMTFDHRLLDARGAEAFLNMFQLEQEEPGEHYKKVSIRESARLDRWKEQFDAGRDTACTLSAMAKNAQPVFPLPKAQRKKGFKFKVISFDKTQTEHIVKKAYSEAGYLLVMPYFLTVAVQALHKAFCGKNIRSGDYIIPVSTDTRTKDQLPEKTFFNYVSFFIFRISQEKADDFSCVLNDIKEQMYDQVKQKKLQNFNKASNLLRIVPLAILGPLMKLLKQWPIGSFCSSYVGENTYNFSKFMDKDVVNIYHMPRPPVSPGVGIYFNQFKGKLNATLSYVDGILNEDEVNSIAGEVKAKLNS